MASTQWDWKTDAPEFKPQVQDTAEFAPEKPAGGELGEGQFYCQRVPVYGQMVNGQMVYQQMGMANGPMVSDMNGQMVTCYPVTYVTPPVDAPEDAEATGASAPEEGASLEPAEDEQGQGQTKSQTKGDMKGQTNGQMNGQVNGQTNGQMNGQVNGQTNGQMNGQVNGQTNGQMNGQVNGQTNGQRVNGQMNGQMVNSQLNGQMMSGQVMNGQMMNGQMSGQMNDQMNGPMNGQASGQGEANGQTATAQVPGAESRSEAGEDTSAAESDARPAPQMVPYPQMQMQWYPVQPLMQNVQWQPHERAEISQAQRQARMRNLGDAPDIIVHFLESRNGRAPLSLIIKERGRDVVRATGRKVTELLELCSHLFNIQDNVVELKNFTHPTGDVYEVSHAFHPPSRQYGELPLVVGELVSVTEKTQNGWACGYKVKARGVAGSGWFPLSSVAPLQATLRRGATRTELFEALGERFVKSQEGVLSLELRGFQPSLRDEDLGTFCQWVAPKVAGHATCSVDLSCNALSDVQPLLTLLAANDVTLAKLDLAGNQVSEGVMEELVQYVQAQPARSLVEVNLERNPRLHAHAAMRLIAAFHNHPAYGHAREPHVGAVWLKRGTNQLDHPASILCRTHTELGVKLTVEEECLSRLPSEWRTRGLPERRFRNAVRPSDRWEGVQSPPSQTR